MFPQWDMNNAAAKKWADSVYQKLSQRERIAQLLMIPVYANKNIKHVRQVHEYIQNYNIGGLILMQGTPLKFSKYINYFQQTAKTPLLLSIDGEWGASMRWDSLPIYPKQMTMGALSDKSDSLIYYMALQVGKECKRLGIHINFAPVVDINNNPLNPVIGIRSFGEDKIKVTRKAWLYSKGLMDSGIMPVIKHFPGHGDTEVDSHKDLPIINCTKERLDTLELYPFKELIKNQIPAVMVAHLSIPALDSSKNRPATLSKKIITDLLINELNFKGLIFTDAMNMKGVAKYFPIGVAEIEAIKAGNDVLLFSEDVPKVITAIESSIKDSVLSWNRIEYSCKKILMWKYLLNIQNNKFVKAKSLYQDIYKNNIPQRIIENISQNAVTLLQNKDGFLPLDNLKNKKIIHITIGDSATNTFNDRLKTYVKPDDYSILNYTKVKQDSLIKIINPYNIVIVQIIQKKLFNGKNINGIDSIIPIIENIAKNKSTILVLSAPPYILNKFSQLENFKATILCYENKKDLSKSATDIIFGVNNPQGKLPVSANYPIGTGLSFNQNIRLAEIAPESFNINSDILNKKVDSLVTTAIKQKVFPGCQIVAIKNGKIFFRKSYGNLTYNDSADKVTNSTIYDLASVTKIASSALALMKLHQEKKFDYKKSLEYYLPEVKHTNKQHLIIEDILTHQSGLQAFIPFYAKAIEKQKRNEKIFYSDSTEQFSIRVSSKMWMHKNYLDTLWNQLLQSKLKESGKYVYSDLGYYFMKKIIERQTGVSLDNYVTKNFYEPMHLQLTYNPLKYFSKQQIAPTEYDKEFRNELIQGYVHDPGAAMLGGVAGHAGVFGNATDLATLMQMLLNGGSIFNTQLLDSAVIKDFTSCHFCPKNRRGLCFEKPAPLKEMESPVPDCCSLNSFGHYGFTGTMAWADPDEKLVVVFLSNRVYPDAKENKLAKSGLRGTLLKIFYDAVRNYYPYGIVNE